MALVAHQLQGLYLTSSSRYLSFSKSLKLKQCLTKHHMIGGTDWHYQLQQNICLSIGPPGFLVSKLKPLRISGFKGRAQYDDSGPRVNRLKVPKTSIRLEEGGEAHNVPLSYASDENEGLASSSTAIHRLFKKWLSVLLTQPSRQEVEDTFGESLTRVSPEGLLRVQSKENGEVLKVAWSHFLALDATIKIPLLIFVPFYMAVNVIYGAEVSKQLTPLWVLGPIIMALYIVIIRRLCALYAFSFNQTVKLLKNLPSYCMLAYRYIFSGKLKEDITTHLLQPILRIKNIDNKKLTRSKLKELEEWIVEKYLDIVESIWPYYCRTIRFLKRANLI